MYLAEMQFGYFGSNRLNAVVVNSMCLPLYSPENIGRKSRTSRTSSFECPNQLIFCFVAFAAFVTVHNGLSCKHRYEITALCWIYLMFTQG